MEMKQNLKFLIGTYPDLTSFIIGRKMLQINYFNDFCNWHLSTLLEK